MSDKTVQLTANDLKDMFLAVIQESKKPAPPTEDELLRKQQEQDLRAMEAKQQADKVAARKQLQQWCTHRHKNGQAAIGSREDPTMHALICVKCQALIKRHPEPTDEADRYIYDEKLFYALISSLTTTDF